MARAHVLLCLSTLTLTLLLLPTPTLSAKFTITNNCSYTVWPAIVSSGSSSLQTTSLQTTGFALPKGDSHSIAMPTSWNGRLWGRTFCSSNSSGNFTCETGDCGTSTINCSLPGSTNATFAEFQLNGALGLDFYDINVIYRYNLGMLVFPHASSGKNCRLTGCSMDLNLNCPSELKVIESANQIVACKSPCNAYGSPEYCCTGEYAGPDVCKPTPYSNIFKTDCPTAYSYVYDDSTSTFTCSGADYVITFCPDAASLKLLQDSTNPPPAPGPPMVFLSGNDTNKSHQASFAMHSSSAPVILVLVASWLLTHFLISLA